METVAGPSDKLNALDAAIDHCERALATLDAAGLFGEGAALSSALDRLREIREELRLSGQGEALD